MTYIINNAMHTWTKPTSFDPCFTCCCVPSHNWWGLCTYRIRNSCFNDYVWLLQHVEVSLKYSFFSSSRVRCVCRCAPQPLNLVESIHHIRAQTVSSLLHYSTAISPEISIFQSCPQAFSTELLGTISQGVYACTSPSCHHSCMFTRWLFTCR